MAVAQLDPEVLEEGAFEAPEHIFITYWKRLTRHKLAVASLFTLLGIFLLVAFGPVILANQTYYNVADDAFVNYGRDVIDLRNTNARPSAEHWMGTDELGRDVFFRIMVAGRLSLTIAFAVVFIRETIGTILGAISGYFAGWVDSLIQRLAEFFIILPALPVLLTLSSIFRDFQIPGVPPEWSQAIVIIIILSVLGWPSSCRLSRGMVLSLRNQEFTEASKALGMSDIKIIFRHMIPNAIPPIIVNATLGLGGVILVESALSFLGFGINPPVATWGNMLQDVQNDMFQNPAKALYPGMFIFISSLAFNYLGDGLRDALDPRLKL